MPLPFANRKQRRAATKVERQTGGIVVDAGELAKLAEMQRLFVAIVKDQGRVRISKATLEGLTDGDRITSKVSDSDVTLSYVPAEPEEAKPG